MVSVSNIRVGGQDQSATNLFTTTQPERLNVANPRSDVNSLASPISGGQRWDANKLFLLSNVVAHDLTRELQMRYRERDRNTPAKRPALSMFNQIGRLREKIGTLRKKPLQRAWSPN